MTQSIIHAGSSLRLAIAYEKDGTEKTIGFATSFNFSQTLGSQPIMGIDSVFPQEIALAGSPSMIQGSMTLYMLKGTDPIRSGIVPPVVDFNKKNSSQKGDSNNYPMQAPSRYMHFRFYDRATNELIISVEFCKITNWSASMQARGVVQAQVNFIGMWASYGE